MSRALEAEEDPYESYPNGTRALLRTPAAREAFPRLRGQSWIAKMIEQKNPVYRRLGAKLLILEILCEVSPEHEREAREAVLLGRKPGRPEGWRSANGRARCRFCPRLISVKNDGTLRAHAIDPVGHRVANPCSGSGLTPVAGSNATDPKLVEKANRKRAKTRDARLVAVRREAEKRAREDLVAAGFEGFDWVDDE